MVVIVAVIRLLAFLHQSTTTAILIVGIRIARIDRTFSWTLIVDLYISLFVLVGFEFFFFLLFVDFFIPI